jgi:hypothetical protein
MANRTEHQIPVEGYLGTEIRATPFFATFSFHNWNINILLLVHTTREVKHVRQNGVEALCGNF